MGIAILSQKNIMEFPFLLDIRKLQQWILTPVPIVGYYLYRDFSIQKYFYIPDDIFQNLKKGPLNLRKVPRKSKERSLDES